MTDFDVAMERTFLIECHIAVETSERPLSGMDSFVPNHFVFINE